MRVVTGSASQEREFKTIRVGEVFLHGHEAYMRVVNAGSLNVVELKSGCLYLVSPDTKVIRVEGYYAIEKVG